MILTEGDALGYVLKAFQALSMTLLSIIFKALSFMNHATSTYCCNHDDDGGDDVIHGDDGGDESRNAFCSSHGVQTPIQA